MFAQTLVQIIVLVVVVITGTLTSIQAADHFTAWQEGKKEYEVNDGGWQE